jgi:RNA polymerase sigma-70 factor, ECF subfamily
MLRLAERYGHRPPEEFALLFHRIMQNAIRDWYRRQKVRSGWMVLASALAGKEEEADPLDGAPDPGDHPGQQLEKTQVLEIIQKEMERLPARQREAFVMRYLDELNVAETARAMRCSEGSVKTHCSRAAHALAAALKARGIEL